MLSEFSGVLGIDVRTTCLHHREKHDRPEDPRQLDDLVYLKILILLDQCLTRRWIRRGTKALMCDLRKDKEY